MARYSRKKQVSEHTKDEAMKIARGIQKPGQTKEQTKLIAQGIQKGIDQHKNIYKEKSRELDKRCNNTSAGNVISESSTDMNSSSVSEKRSQLPWFLLILSWFCFAVYIFTG